MSYCLDANILISIWNTDYPRDVFPTLYQEMENNLQNEIILIQPIFDEIEPYLPEDEDKLAVLDKTTLSTKEKNIQSELLGKYPARIWLERKMHISKTLTSAEVESLAVELIEKYEKYETYETWETEDEPTKGADHNDLKLIAFASLGRHTVVTYEAKQQQPPEKKSNYKIPLICKEENVKCIRFVEMLRQCNIVI